MIDDIRFAFRQFAKTRGVTAAIVLSLALGIAANAVVLGWMYRFVREPLRGVPRQNELAVVVSNVGSGCVSLPDLRDLAAPATFAGALASMPTAACLTLDRQPQWLEAQVVTANYFAVLGVRPLLGRTFLPDEDKAPGGNPVLVISERLWRRAFKAAPDVVGRVVDVNRHAFTIIGVVPAAFEGTLPPSIFDLWAPASMIWEVRNQGRNFLTSRTARGWHNLARLQPGVTLGGARAVVATADMQLKQSYPNENAVARHRLVPLSECPWGAQTVVGPTLKLLLAVSLAVQAIVAANVANLLLARAADRQREVAIRLASGATPSRLVRQFLTESVLLAVCGGALGILLAAWAVDGVFWWILPKELAGGARFQLSLNAATIGWALGLACATGVLFGLAPALHALRTDLVHALKEGARSTGGAAHLRLRRLLVIGEVAIAVVLLVSAGLCARGLRQARRVDVGFNRDHVLLGQLRIGMNGYTPDNGPTFYRELRQRLAGEPGVEEAALASWFPLGLAGCKGSAVEVDGYERHSGENPIYEYAIISPRYFATMGIPLVGGRDFTDADDGRAARVAIVNEHFARRFWPGQDAIGRRFRSGGMWRTVVGVAKAGKYNRLDEEPWPFFYLPYQQGVPDLDLEICVRTAAAPEGFGSGLRAAVHRADPGVELLRTTTLKSYSSMAAFAPYLAASLLGLLGDAALLLAAMGVYAVVAYSVSQRTREFGVRMALGAKPPDLLAHVVRQGLVLVGTGVGVGVLLALAVTRLLRGFLYGVSPFDAATFVGVAVVLLIVAVVASLVPARRAARVNPIEALRAE